MANSDFLFVTMNYPLFDHRAATLRSRFARKMFALVAVTVCSLSPVIGHASKGEELKFGSDMVAEGPWKRGPENSMEFNYDTVRRGFHLKLKPNARDWSDKTMLKMRLWSKAPGQKVVIYIEPTKESSKKVREENKGKDIDWSAPWVRIDANWTGWKEVTFYLPGTRGRGDFELKGPKDKRTGRPVLKSFGEIAVISFYNQWGGVEDGAGIKGWGILDPVAGSWAIADLEVK